MRVLVIGGSLGGLFAAALLHRAGLQVSVFERSTHGLAGRGAGLVLQPRMTELLAELGLTEVAAAGVTAYERIHLDVHGNVIARQATPQGQVSWDRVFEAVRTLVPTGRYVGGRVAVEVGQGRGSAWVRFAGDSTEHGELVIGADGIGSVTRATVLGEGSGPRYAGYAAWRGLIPEGAMPAAAAAVLHERFAFYDADGSHALGYLVPGPHGETGRGRRRYNWVWYRRCPEADGSLAAALTDAAGRRHPFALPPGGMAEVAREALRLEASRSLPPPFAAAVQAEPRPFVQGIFDRAAAARIASGRVALLGDAAVLVRPHTAMGVDKAAADALALRDALSGAGGSAGALGDVLAYYDATRRPAGEAIATYGRRLGAAFV